MVQDKITVVTPVYNAAAYIDRFIKSLEDQTRKDFEVIFVDDFSQDNSVELLKKAQSAGGLRMRIFQNEQNQGPAYSRNKGINNTQTEFITFCDCDDWYDPTFIEKMAGLLEKNGVELAFCGYKVVNESGVTEERPLKDTNGRLSKEDVFILDSDSLCMMMATSRLMKATLLPDLRNGEDVATVSLLMAKTDGVAVTKDCLYNYYRRAGSASENPNMNVFDSLVSSFMYTKNNFPTGMNNELEYQGIKNLLYSSLITLFSFSYDTKKASEIIDDFEIDFPNWSSNKYLQFLNRNKRLVLFFVKHRLFVCIKIVAVLRKAVIK